MKKKNELQTIDEKYSTDVQKYYIEWLLKDRSSFLICRSEFKFDYFDGTLRGAVREINSYFDKTGSLPSLEYINAKTNVVLCSGAADDADYMIAEYEGFVKTKAMEQCIFDGVDLLNQGKQFELRDKIIEAAKINLSSSKNIWVEAEASIEDCYATPDAVWLLDGFWQQGGITNLYSESNLGKTWVALDMALRIASGMLWHGKAINRKGGKVLYIGAEAPASARRRAADWAQLYDARSKLNDFKVITKSLDLLNKDTVQKFIEGYKKTSIECIFIDTLACSMSSGENENSNNEMAAVVEALKSITTELDCAVMVLHHPGKSGATERGGSAYKAGIDTSLKLTTDGEVDGCEILKLETEKQRDGERLTRYFKKVVTPNLRNPSKSTIQLLSYDKKQEKSVELWEMIAEALTLENDRKITPLLKLFNGDKNPNSREIRAIKDQFKGGIFQLNGHEFHLLDNGSLHLV